MTPGVELARAYWHDIVAPIVDAQVPPRERAAALIGQGSEVLGFDTEQSTDHGWGPRVFVISSAFEDRDRVEVLSRIVDERIPDTFGGFRTRFPAFDDAPVRHQVMFRTMDDVFAARLLFDPTKPIQPDDWLRAPTQVLRELTAGDVFEDGPGELTEARANLRWYPDDVWLYVLGCQWRRLAQEEPFVGRCGQVGDDLGSAVLGARVVRDVMRLCFLIEREYAPYSKWLGTAFARLQCGPAFAPLLRSAVGASDWHTREAHLVTAFEAVATRFNDLHLVDELDPTVRPFYERPFRVLGSQRFADACFAATPLREAGWVGAIDQFVDSTDVLGYPQNVAAVTRSVWPGWQNRWS
jgi:hypothetical protein